jgi:hypothetical protein
MQGMNSLDVKNGLLIAAKDWTIFSNQQSILHYVY